jgi:excinuclease ABC subunit B
LPEVSLVAILDADKEGFLRSDRSLIQTIGRAARNLRGRAILYADTMTGSIQRAIEETSRRRDMQIAFNKEHGIIPKGIEKAVADVMEAGNAPRGGRKGRRQQGKGKADAVPVQELSAVDASKRMKKLEKGMYEAARNLEFERAAQLRDELEELRVSLFKSDGVGVAGEVATRDTASAGEKQTRKRNKRARKGDAKRVS